LGINVQQNLQLVVQVAKEYTEQLGAGKIIELLESHKSYHGLYYYLGASIAVSEDPEVGHLLRGPSPLEKNSIILIKYEVSGGCLTERRGSCLL
jgi:hypothetical protein